VPGIRRSPSGRRQTEALSAVPGSRTRAAENDEERNGEACIGDGAGRRDARRWPTPHEDNERLTPPQGGEPERRRDERRMRRQAVFRRAD
jgi:hypothetical protein